MKKIICNILAALVVIITLMVPAYAYLDASGGSILIQALFAGVAGLCALVKVYWHKLKNLLRRLVGKPVISEENTMNDIEADDDNSEARP